MTHPLESARLKINRAHEARQSLNAQVRTFLSSQPYGVAADIDPNTGEGVLRLRIVTSPPPVWGPIIGEILHDVRSALDHVAYALSGLHKGPAPVPLSQPWRDIAFPITDTPGWFKSASNKRLWAVAPQDRAVIESMQPYKGWNGGRLAYISALSNIDKHRKIHLVAAMFESRERYISSIVPEGCIVVDVRITARNPLEDGAELARFTVERDPDAPKASVHVDHEFTFDIAFRDGGPTSGWDLDVIGVLQVITFDAQAVVEAFEHRFP